MKRLAAFELAAVSALTMLAALGFGRVFATSGYVLPAFGAVLVAVAIAGNARVRRATTTASLLWSFPAFLTYTAYVALGGTTAHLLPTTGTVEHLATGLTGGWADLLTVSLPATVEPDLLVCVLALVWAAAAVGAGCVHRSRNAVVPVLPALVLYLVALGFGASQPAGTLVLPAAFSVVLLVVFLLHANRWVVIEPSGLDPKPQGPATDPAGRHRPLSVHTPATRWIALGLPVVAASTLLAGIAVAGVPLRAPAFDPRSLRDQRVDVADVANPLDGLKGELTAPSSEPTLRYRIGIEAQPGGAAVDRLRLAVLDRFDGAGWSSTARFDRTGAALPEGPDPGVRTDEVLQTVQVLAAPPGPWLPAADRPVTVEVDGDAFPLAIDPVTAVLISAGGDPTGSTYRVVSMVMRPTPQQLAALSRPTITDATAGLVDVTDMPVALRQLAQRLSEARNGAGPTPDSPYARLTRLQNALATGYDYREDTPSGSSYGRLTNFLTIERSGYAEQFAGAFAVLARSLGYPSRLVVGYLTTDTDPVTGATVARTEITNRQAHVWPEVLLGDGLWVPFEPTPPRRAATTVEPTDPVADARTGGLVPEAQRRAAEPASAGSTGGASGRADGPGSALLVGVAALLAIGVLVPLGLVVLKRGRRRRRRNQPSTAEQVLGAWAEVTDRLLEIGLDIDRSMTAKDVLATAGPRLSPPAAELLAAMVPLVGVALYSPDGPDSTAATMMWTHAEAFRSALHDGDEWYRSTLARVSPRPLLSGVTRR